MEYYIMNTHHGTNKQSGKPFTSHSFLNGSFAGMMSFGGVYRAIKYPDKKSAEAMAKGRKGLRIISVTKAMELLAEKTTTAS